MFSPLRNRFGIPGVISVIALVFAMFGGAYAATNTGKATSSAKAKKGPRGPKGATGPAGPQGPAGAKGDAGANGSNGSNGADGKSVTGVAIAAGGECGAGVTGVKYTLDGVSTKVCNGKNGTNGKDGETGFTKKLPPGETETGAWAYGQGPSGTQNISLSFNIPLEKALDSAQVHYIDKDGNEVSEGGGKVEPTPECEGTAGNPTAASGNLCIYTGFASEILTWTEFITPVDSETPGASPVGAIFKVVALGSGASAWGSWAVTAEE
jgi:hypothetical protein